MAAALGGSYYAATLAVERIERQAERDISMALAAEGETWVDVSTDGLLVTLDGTAADEATRFRAISIAGRFVDAARVIDDIDVAAPEAVEVPDFSIEFLRNGDRISFFGLVPEAVSRDDIRAHVAKAAPGAALSDLLQTADYPVPPGWNRSLAFAIEALAELPRSKISFSPGEVSITAITESRADRATTEARLNVSAPPDIRLELHITAPRPVISPFTLRALLDDDGLRFDACTADTEIARERILAVARETGLRGQATCTIGLGAPTANWADAVEAGLEALSDLGGGSITFSDTDVTLVALATAPPDQFDATVGALDERLPDTFRVHGVLPDPPALGGAGESATPEISARLALGVIEVKGRLLDPLSKTAVQSFAKSRFGADSVKMATRLDGTLPEGWTIRVLAGLEAMSELAAGELTVRPDFVEIAGTTGNPDAAAEISRILSGKLGEGEDFSIDVTYDESLDPLAALPTPEECFARIETVLRAFPKITFAPASAEIEEAGLETIDQIAEALRDCETVRLQIGGHTDSQGRESMNLNLSQARADAVLNAIMARRVLTTNLTAKGYGETVPIADNDTEEGREANRRIEFKLIRDVENDPTAEAAAAAAEAAE